MLSLTEAIPGQWKRWIKDKGGPPILDMYKVYLNLPKATGLIYKNLNHNELLLSNNVKKWSEIFDNLSSSKFVRYVKNIYTITNIPKLQSFQYHLLMNVVITNVHLKRFTIRDNDLCSFCNRESETRKHLFFSCEHTKKFWDQFQNEYLSNNNIINYQNVVFNLLVDNPKMLPNLLTLLAKHYIYVTFCKKNSLSFNAFKQNIIYYENLERCIAIKNDEVGLHNAKWAKIIST